MSRPRHAITVLVVTFLPTWTMTVQAQEPPRTDVSDSHDLFQRRPTFFFGAGGGISHVNRGGYNRDPTDAGPGSTYRVGIGLSRKVLVSVDYERHHTNDEDPLASDLVMGPDGHHQLRSPGIFRTDFLMLSLQTYLARGLFLRPSLGVGANVFASYRIQGDEVVGAGLSWDGSPIGGLGIAAGYDLRLGRLLVLEMEGLYRHSTGEDSTAPRNVLGLQISGLVVIVPR